MKVGDMVFNHKTKKPCVLVQIGSEMFDSTKYSRPTRIAVVINVGEAQKTYALMDRLEKMKDG
jgi:hypothetical protein